MKRILKGSFTIEAAVVIPLLLFAIGIIMMLLFYCHDKNVLQGAVSEAATVENGRSGGEDYNSLVRDKLLWLRNPKIKVTKKDGYVVATAEAVGYLLHVQVGERMTITEPETFIRNVRKIKKITGGENENILSDGFE